MDMCPAMSLPATPEASRARRSERPRQEEEPLVSFPTMLERSARHEETSGTAREVTRSDKSHENHTNQAPQSPAGKSDEAGTATAGPATTGKTQEANVSQSETTVPKTVAAIGQSQQGEVAPNAVTTDLKTGEGLTPTAPAGETVAVADPAVAKADSQTAAPVMPGQAAAINLEELPEEVLIRTVGSGQSPAPQTEAALAVDPAQATGTKAPGEATPAASTPATNPGVAVLPEAEAEALTTEEPATEDTEEGASAASQATDGDTEALAEPDGEIVEIKTVPAQQGPATPAENARPVQGAEARTEEATNTVEDQAEALPAGAEEAQQSLKLQQAKQKYEQPQIVSGPEENRITLADLDLDSGSMDSFLGRDSLTAALKSAALKSSPLQQHIRQQVSQQVVEHLRSEMAGEKLTLRLNPEELGQVEINFHALDDRLTVSMSAENKQAESALKDGARELADSIGEKSSRFSMIEVRVDSRGQQDQGKNEPRQDDQRRERENDQNPSHNQEQSGHRRHQPAPHQTGASEWAAFHLGGQ